MLSSIHTFRVTDGAANQTTAKRIFCPHDGSSFSVGFCCQLINRRLGAL